MHKNSYSLYLYGFLPLLFGFLLNLLINIPFIYGFILIFLNIIFLFLWGYLANRVSLTDEAPLMQALKFNAVGLLCLVLLLGQRYFLGQYLLNFLGFLPQIYFLPVLSIAGILFNPVFSLFGPVIDTAMGWPAAFICLFISSLIGFIKAKR